VSLGQLLESGGVDALAHASAACAVHVQLLLLSLLLLLLPPLTALPVGAVPLLLAGL
jgi:hypothetical protein